MPDKVFDTLSLAEKTVIRSQIADKLPLVPKLKIPKTESSFGGPTFDEAGNVVSA